LAQTSIEKKKKKKKKKKGVFDKGRQHKDKKGQVCQHKYKEDVMDKGEKTLEYTLGVHLGNLSLYIFLFTA
jgi:N-acetylmuramoyl-L-alanine amidase CwlA